MRDFSKSVVTRTSNSPKLVVDRRDNSPKAVVTKTADMFDKANEETEATLDSIRESINSEFTVDDNIPIMSMDELEELRVEYNRRSSTFLFRFVVVLVVLGVWIFLSMNVYPTQLGFRLGIVPVGLLLGVWWTLSMTPLYKALTDFGTAYKQTFVMECLRDVFDNIVYRPFSGISNSVFQELNVLKSGRCISDDYIKALYKGVEFEYSNVTISRDVNRNDRTKSVTLFKGIWMIFDFDTNDARNIQVVEAGFNNAKHNRVFGKVDELYKKVVLDDVSFSDHFTIFAQSADDAVRVLTPDLVSRIKRTAKAMPGKMIFCFVNNKLYVGVSTGSDAFAIRYKKGMAADDVKERVMEDIKPITTIIENLYF